MSPEALLNTKIIAKLPAGPIGVAVSGGGDSLALLHLLKTANLRPLMVATVDHGLRDASAAEASTVAQYCAQWGINHVTLQWHGWDGHGNLQDAARRARHRLLSQWARDNALQAIALGHTLDDQAETFLMRLARGSGVDGLAAMEGARLSDGIVWLRPVLGSRRTDLQSHLRAHGIDWVDDPSNEDARFDRIAVRQALPALADIGIDPIRLTDTAHRMRMAQEVLNAQALALAQAAAEVHPAGFIRLDCRVLADAAEDTQLRLLASALNWVAGATYRPRFDALRKVASLLLSDAKDAKATLHGTVVCKMGPALLVTREVAATGPPTQCGKLWDQLWQTQGPESAETRAPTSEELATRPEWRDQKIPRAALLACPAFFQNGKMVAAPFASPTKEWHSWRVAGPEFFYAAFTPR